MNLNDLEGKNVAILGFSLEGFSTAKYLAGKGIKFSVIERKRLEDLDGDAREFIKNGSYEYLSGEDHLNKLLYFNTVFRSPGMPLWNTKVKEAVDSGVVLSSQTKLFFELCLCPIIGVTGTKGKGTTATLIYEMLKACGKDVYLGGNIGRPPLDFLDGLTKDSLVVLELSSFQLEDLNKSPHVAVVLMVTQEHLDSKAPDSPNYHRSVKDYAEAKRNIVRFQGEGDFAVINYDFEQSRDFAKSTKAKVHFFSVLGEVESGAFLNGDDLVIRMDGHDKALCKRSEVFLRGEHNIQNILAAAAASLVSGAKLNEITEVIKSFRGLEHRLEFVREIDRVKYYNDSFSTTPETAIAAIKSFKEPEIVILGGSEKGSDYSELGRQIAGSRNLKAVILIGKTAGKIKEAIAQNNPRLELLLVEGLNSMDEIVKKAKEISSPQDVVVLSPACASFDMFRNYKDRGDQFKREVINL